MRGAAGVGRVALAAFLVAFVGGCTSTTHRSESGSVLIVAAERPESMLAAQVDGSLELTSGGCFTVRVPGDGGVVTVFPPGTRLVAENEIDIPVLGRVAIGGRVTGGGGLVPAELAPVEVPEECVGDEVRLLNPYG